jgi:hypothetical protein
VRYAVSASDIRTIDVARVSWKRLDGADPDRVFVDVPDGMRGVKVRTHKGALLIKGKGSRGGAVMQVGNIAGQVNIHSSPSFWRWLWTSLFGGTDQSQYVTVFTPAHRSFRWIINN